MRLFLPSLLFSLITACASRTPAPTTPSVCNAKIARVWHGRTTNAKADAYAAYLVEEISKGFPGLPGNLGYQMMRETVGDETHFSVISYWSARDAIHAFAGADISKTHPSPRDPEFLIDPEPEVRNYDLAVQAFGCPR
jgi:heme-degrading monooxygenase HmoA